MQVIEISDTVQEINGERFYLCGNYFQHRGKRLHRYVWELHNGKIPKGFHVHHKDQNRSNNQIDNLELLQGHDHLSQHMCEEARAERSRKTIETARVAACKWHGSEEGLKWHSIRGKENWKTRKLNTYTCTYCGKEFQTKHIYGAGQNHFCHPNHKAAYGRKKHESAKS